MDSELEKQFDEHRKRLKEITKLAYDQFGDNHEMFSDISGRIQNVVKESIPVVTEATKLKTIARNVVVEVDKFEDYKNVVINDIYEQEAQKEIPVPTFTFEQEYHEFVSALRQQDGEDSFIVSQQPEGAALDPWTKQPIKNPMKSKQCGHIFDRASVRAATQKRRDFRCPYIGCKLRLTLADLEED